MKFHDNETHSNFYHNVLLPKNKLKESDKEPPIGEFYPFIDWFFELNTCRSPIALCAISFTEIHKFAMINDIEEFDEFNYLMRILDNVYIKHYDKENKNGTSTTSKGNNGKNKG